ncbi:glycosyltransferase family 2 protein [Kiloniella sp. EL199]|uniref:glycosyltransferase family 2 protein n=1 Tax=Kiloniella sp. EL199 TaxID=2107581 RepID=UPI000EA1863C|nr:glycosyltransferase family 2 protein [Kiloniella sp. EL199]
MVESYTVVIPCFNEAENIGPLFERLKAQLSEASILFVNDGSSDNSLELIKELAEKDKRVFYLSLTKNFGLDAAFACGFKYCASDWIIQMDADLQSPPEEIPKLISKANEGYDIVFARRLNRQDSFLKKAGSRLQHFLARTVFRIDFPVGASTFRIVRRDVAKRVISRQTAYPYFLAECMRLGLKHSFIDYEHAPRHAGVSKFTFGKSLRATMKLFIGHSTVPLGFFAFSLIISTPLLFGAPGNFTISIILLLMLTGFWVQAGYIRRLVREQMFHRAFLVRESNLEVQAEDRLYDS